MQSGTAVMAATRTAPLSSLKDPEELLSVPVAAQEAGGVSKATIRRYLTLKLLRRFKVGSRTFVKRGDLMRLIREVK
jgi:hypothetical protein